MQPNIGPDWAESAYLDALTDDGQAGFVMRLARYPGHAVSWLWLHLFLPEGVVGYNDNALPLTGPPEATPLDAADVTHELTGDNAGFVRRIGARTSPEHASIYVAVRAHRAAHAPDGAGAVPLRVRAEFTPSHRADVSRPGRVEVFGAVTAEVTIEGQSFALNAAGFWHEQVGNRPNFAAAFTHSILRGETISMVGTSLARGGIGFALTGGETSPLSRVDITPPGVERTLDFELASGERAQGVARRTHSYSTPAEEGRRPASVVVAETDHGKLWGHINDWRPA